MLGISQSMTKLSGVLESTRVLGGPLRVHLMKNKLNCAESRKSSTDGDDPSIHGLDPKIYTTPTGSVSSYSVPDGAVPNGTVSTSNSWPENEPRPKGLGLIHCTLQHFPVRKRLRVNVLKIEGLAGDLKPELELQPFCKVNLLPGKSSKAQISFVKRGRDAVFNQEFFFDGVPLEELDSKILQIEVLHSSNQKLQKDIEIGEITVPLRDLTQLHSKKEVKIVEELKHKVCGKKAGKINLTTCVSNGVLTVNIIKVEDLPKWGFIGAPDVCVRVTVNQESGKLQNQVKQSRVMKSTCSAVYKESIAFLIQGKMNDLLKTQVIVSVHDFNRTVTGDDVIGSVYFGCKESEKAEADQWKSTIEHQGKEIKGTHHLKPPNSGNPDVHVSEAHSDSEE
uniref:C2 domain-containing protein n=1 Tax=Panagrolaimus sp. JU765 TaxID=591449 RepID=A0AC34RK25_9BILA